MKKILTLLLITFCLFACDDFTSQEDVNIKEIEDILLEIELGFNMNDLSRITTFYHQEFLHNNEDYDDEVYRWEQRIIKYLEMDIENIEITFQNDYWAVAEFKLTFSNADETAITEEPSEENGDLSFFTKENSEWKIIGNQAEKKPSQD